MNRLLLLCCCVSFMGGCGHRFVSPAIVVGKSYSPSNVSTGVGPVMGGKGGVAFTTSYIPEKYVILVQYPNGVVVPVETNGSQWASMREGERLTVKGNSMYGIDGWEVQP